MDGSAKEERKKEMIRLREEEFYSLQQIAITFKVSRETVRLIIGNTGRGYTVKRNLKKLEQHADKNDKAIAEITGLSISTLRNYRGKTRHTPRQSVSQAFCAEGVEIVSQALRLNGIENELLPDNHAFDIRLSNGFTIRVKRSGKAVATSDRRQYYVFNTEKNHLVDFFALLTPSNDIYFVPSYHHSQIRIASMPERKSKYDQYKNKFSILRKED